MSSLFSRRFSLRWFLILPYVVQILLVVSLTGWLSYQNGQETLKNLASKLLAQAKSRVHEQTDHLLMQAQSLAIKNAFLYEQNYISLIREKELQSYLWQQRLNFKPEPHSIYFGDEEGRFLSVRTGNRVSIAIPNSKQRDVYQVDPRTQERTLLETQPFELRQRSWYKQAKNSNEPIWTKPYEFATPGNLGITTAQAIRDPQGKLRAVSAVDLSLKGLNVFLQSIQISPTTKLFIVDDEGQLVASSIKNKRELHNTGVGKTNQELIKQPYPPLLRQSLQHLQKLPGGLDQLDNTHLLELTLQGEKHYLSTLSYDFGSTLNWHVIVLVSERDFSQQISKNNRITILLCALSIFCALAVGGLITRILTSAIRHLELTTDQITQGHWQLPTSSIARTKEMGSLMDSFESMVKRLQQVFSELEGYAYQDPLTGLPNRAALLTKLDYAISVAKDTETPNFSLLWLNIDSFVRIETGLGEHTAELLLLEVTRRLQENLQSSPFKTFTLARIERDDFVILFGNLTHDFSAQEVAQTILQDFQAPFRLGQQDVVVTASIGIFIDQGENDSSSTVLRNANIARFEAKRHGKGRFIIFDGLMRAQNAERLQLEADLRYAIEREELELWYQPLISVKPEQISGFEALVRWRHPTAGIISPDKFIFIAEETGAIASMGLWILKTACQQMRQWQDKISHLQSAYVSVNVSAQQLLIPDFVEKVQQILNETGLSGQSLQLEITESAAVSQPQAISPKLQYLQSLGIRICMDDFGTGYCQLSYLLQLPVDAIKIDRSFINEIGSNTPKAEIAKILLTLSQSLSLEATAEGVETFQQYLDLQLHGCNKFQGYLFAAPLPIEKIPDFTFSLPQK